MYGVSFATTHSQNAIKDLNKTFVKDLQEAEQLMKKDWAALHPEQMKQAQHDKNYQGLGGSLNGFRTDKMGAEQQKHQYKSFSEAMGEKPSSSAATVVAQLTDSDKENIEKYKEFQKLFRKFCRYQEVPFLLYKELLVITYSHSDKRVLSFMTDRTIKIVLDYYHPGGAKARAVIDTLKTIFHRVHATDDSDVGSREYYVNLGFSQDDASYLKEEYYCTLSQRHSGPTSRATELEKTTVAREVAQKFIKIGAFTAHRFFARVDEEVLDKLEIVRGKIENYQRQQEVQPALRQAEAISCDDLQPSAPTTPLLRVARSVSSARLTIATATSPKDGMIETHRFSLISIASPSSTGSPSKGSTNGSANTNGKTKPHTSASPETPGTNRVRRALVFSTPTSPSHSQSPAPLWSAVAGSPRSGGSPRLSVPETVTASS